MQKKCYCGLKFASVVCRAECGLFLCCFHSVKPDDHWTLSCKSPFVWFASAKDQHLWTVKDGCKYCRHVFKFEMLTFCFFRVRRWMLGESVSPLSLLAWVGPSSVAFGWTRPKPTSKIFLCRSLKYKKYKRNQKQNTEII